MLFCFLRKPSLPCAAQVPFTEYISTRWYRAPECLLTDGYYGFKMDTWSVGCVFFEIATLRPLFPGTNEVDQLDKIHNIIGVSPQALCCCAGCLPQTVAHPTIRRSLTRRC